MDRDTFIITVYCLVEDEFKTFRAVSRGRHAGFTPELSDAEVITRAICGEDCQLHTDKDLCAYFAHHYHHFFPPRSERRLFVRQAAHLWQCTAALQRRLPCLSGQAHDPVQPIATRPLPVCTYTRARRDRCVPGQADYGDCDAQDWPYYGVKLGGRLARCGMLTHCPLLAASPHDITHLEGLVEGFHSLVPADQGVSALPLQQQLAQEQGGPVVTPRKQNMRASLYPVLLVNTCARWRQLVATVGAHLPERFGVHRMRVPDLWPFQPRRMRKVLAHTVAVFLHLTLGRQPLDLDGLVAS